MTRPQLTVAEVIRSCLDEFLERFGPKLTPEQRRALKDLTACRTAALGGHRDQCPRCGYRAISFNSCRNRHCPKCQSLARAQWLQDRQAKLLNTEYFHVVFTVPEQIATISYQNKRELYGRDLLQIGASTSLAYT